MVPIKLVDNIVTTPYNENSGGENKVTTQRIRTGLRIPESLNTKLILQAREDGVSKNALILQILREWVMENEKNKNTER